MTTSATMSKASALDDLRLQYSQAAEAVKNIKNLGKVLSEKKTKEEVLKVLNNMGRQILGENHKTFREAERLIAVHGSEKEKEEMTKLYNDAFIPALKDVIAVAEAYKIS